MPYVILFNEDDVISPYLYRVNIEGFKDLKRPVVGDDIFDYSRFGVKYFGTKKYAKELLNKINKDKEKFDDMVLNYPKFPDNIGKIAIRTIKFARENHTYGPYNAKVVELPETIILQTSYRIPIDRQINRILLELWKKS